MVPGFKDFKIPKRPVPAPSVPQPSPLDRAGQDTSALAYCIYCRAEHSSTSYCSRVVQSTMSRRRKKQKKDDTDSGDEESGQDGGGDDSESSEDSSDESSEDSDSSEDSQDTEESEDAGKADVHGPPSSSSALAKFYGETKRIDTIDVSCVLHPETIKFYFKRMYVFVRHWPSLICYFRLGDGKLLKEGAEKLRDKY